MQLATDRERRRFGQAPATGRRWPRLGLPVAAAFGVAAIAAAVAQPNPILAGPAAYGDWQSDRPGVVRKITAADLPAPLATPSVARAPEIVARPEGVLPRAPPGFVVSPFASGLDVPRIVRVAPNGDVFVAESGANRIRVLRAPDGASQAERSEIFADGLALPYGIAFWPPSGEPRYLYVANTGSVVRFPYHSGDLRAGGPPETIVAALPTGGHWTRDIAFSPAGDRMFVAVGSRSNDAEGVIARLLRPEARRADVLAFTPDGKGERVFASGLRNCSGITVAPGSSDVWCAVNERDGLGDNLPPDYVTRVREGDFYGWPWFYIGGHEDPRHVGEQPEMRARVSLPEVLLQPHSAPLGIAFYDAAQFPPEYRGTAFVALHGSWNRAKRTGYKIVRILMRDGRPTGAYEDFLTGFVVDANRVWGRPVGVAIAHDGALLISEDAGGAIWRVSRASP